MAGNSCLVSYCSDCWWSNSGEFSEVCYVLKRHLYREGEVRVETYKVQYFSYSHFVIYEFGNNHPHFPARYWYLILNSSTNLLRATFGWLKITSLENSFLIHDRTVNTSKTKHCAESGHYLNNTITTINEVQTLMLEEHRTKLCKRIWSEWAVRRT